MFWVVRLLRVIQPLNFYLIVSSALAHSIATRPLVLDLDSGLAFPNGIQVACSPSADWT